MAVTLVATAKATNANTYVSLSDANTYADGMALEATGPGTSWNSAADDTKNRALKSATDFLETLEYVSVVTDIDQRLKWPRLGIADSDGREYSDDAIPRFMEEAATELAVRIVNGDWEPNDTGLEGFRRVRVGSLDISPNLARRAALLPEVVRRMLRPYMKGSGTYTTGIVRS